MLKLRIGKGRRGTDLPRSSSRMWVANVISPDEILEDPAIGPGIELPGMPDFASMAEEQIEAIASCSAFHETAIGFFAPKLDEEAMRYCHELHREYEEHSTHLKTTYKSALLDRLKQAEMRLAALPYMQARIGPENNPKEKEDGHEH